MKIALSDSSFAHLQAIALNAHYRRGYREWPADAEEEIIRIARLQIPAEWRPAPLALLSPGKNVLDEMMRSKKLPSVLAVGAFSCVRGPDQKVVYRYVAWLEEEIEIGMNAQNEELFRALDWTAAHEKKA